MAGIEFIIDTMFNNPALPVVPVLGFSDNFNRANSNSLGTTSGEGKLWIEYPYPGTNVTLGIASNQAGQTSGSTLTMTAGVEASAADGVLKATIITADSAGGLRLAARISNATNQLYLQFLNIPGAEVIRLVKYIGGTATTIATSPTLGNLDGSVVEMILSGTSVSVKRNGVQVIAPQTITEVADKTVHGLTASSASPTSRIDSISFTAV